MWLEIKKTIGGVGDEQGRPEGSDLLGSRLTLASWGGCPTQKGLIPLTSFLPRTPLKTPSLLLTILGLRPARYCGSAKDIVVLERAEDPAQAHRTGTLTLHNFVATDALPLLAGLVLFFI